MKPKIELKFDAQTPRKLTADVSEIKMEESKGTPKGDSSLTPRKEKLTIEHFKLLKKIGKGTFGEVFEVVLKNDEKLFPSPKHYALKAIKKRMLVNTNQMKYALSE